MSILLCSIRSALCLLFTYNIATAQIQMLFAGKFEGQKIDAQTDDIWYGLYQMEDQYELIQTQITIEKFRSGLNGDPPDKMTGRRILVDQPHPPIFMIKGMSQLKPGPIETAYYGHDFLHPAQWWSFSLGQKSYALKASGNAIDLGFVFQIENYVIRLAQSEKVQILSEYKSVFPGMGEPNLIWVGDLDLDTNLDILIDLSSSHARKRYVLFLSSVTRENELVGKAAEFVRIVD